jgi:hypothetical protein
MEETELGRDNEAEDAAKAKANEKKKKKQMEKKNARKS